MRKVLIFGGTAEGRSIADCLDGNGIPHTVCVATEYGEEVLSHSALRTIRRGRLAERGMELLLAEGNFAAVVDATHPYAVEVSRNVKSACDAAGLPCLRYLRPAEDGPAAGGGFPMGQVPETEPGLKESSALAQGQAPAGEPCQETEPEQGTRRPRRVTVASALEAARYLEGRQGRVFLTTGSKELPVFTGEISDPSRLFARVLPSAEVVASCQALGLKGKQLCAMQGPFSEEMNRAMLRETGAAFLVTKDTGAAGGFPEKERAAAALGVTLVVIRRPGEAGLTREALLKELSRLLAREITEPGSEEGPSPGRGAKEDGKAARKESGSGTAVLGVDSGLEEESCPEGTAGRRAICCIGIGMGTPDTLTREAETAIREAEILFGAKRILESVRPLFPGRRPSSGNPECPPDADTPRGPVFIQEYDGKRIAAWLAAHPRYTRIAILMSGDVGFYSGARGIGEAFPGEEIRYLCGISSVAYFASRVPTAWQDARLVSAHGKEIHLLNLVQRWPKLILLVSGAGDVERFCRELWEAGLSKVRVTVGSNLSYPEEQVTAGTPADFLRCPTSGLHIMMIENERASHTVVPGIPDDAFVRGKVPMTKEEIRILSVSKLRLREDSVVYDVGAGTGSVAAECARLCTSGLVYAIERNPEGIGLIRENSRRMRLSNVVLVEGLAPKAMEGLPAPTHAFIGGSSGNMGSIIDALREKNPSVRIVLNVIALESLSEILSVLKERGIGDADIVQISAAKSRVLGRCHMMEARNPVYILSFGGER